MAVVRQRPSADHPPSAAYSGLDIIVAGDPYLKRLNFGLLRFLLRFDLVFLSMKFD